MTDKSITPEGYDNIDNEYGFEYHPGLLATEDIDALRSRDAFDEVVSSIDEFSDMHYADYCDLLSVLAKFRNSPFDDDILKWTPPPSRILAPIAMDFARRSLNLDPTATVDDFVRESANRIREQVRERMRNAGIPTGSGGETVPPDSGDGDTTQENYSGGTNFNPTGLSLNLRPVTSNFVTGIVPLYRPKFFLDGRDATAPLILKIKNVWLESARPSALTIYAGSENLQSYIHNKVVADWLNVCSRRVRLNSFTSPLLTTEYIVNYYQTITYCLSVLYFYLSIDAHFRLEKNRNEGMIELYRTLDANDLLQINMLRQILDEIPLDPMVNQFCHHLYDNYKQSYLPGSPLMKFIPTKMIPTSGIENHFVSIESGLVDDCLKMLRNKKFRDFQQLYVQAFPDAVNTKTYSYDGMPKFDTNWLTAFVNSNKETSTSTSAFYATPYAASEDQREVMLLHTDSPDGWIDAANVIYDTTAQKYKGGFGMTKRLNMADDGDSFVYSELCYSAYTQGVARFTSSYIYTEDTTNAGDTIRGFFPLEKRERYVVISGDTSNAHVSSSGVNSFQRFGTQRAMPLSIRDMVPSSMQFCDIMYTPWKFNNKGPSSGNTLTQDANSDSLATMPNGDSDPVKKRKRRRKSKKKS